MVVVGLNLDNESFFLDSVTCSCTVGSWNRGGAGAGVKHYKIMVAVKICITGDWQ